MSNLEASLGSRLWCPLLLVCSSECFHVCVGWLWHLAVDLLPNVCLWIPRNSLTVVLSAIHMLMINAPKLREAESAIIVSGDSFMEICYLPSPTMEILYCCVLSGLPSSVSVVFILWCYTHMPRLRINLISRLQCVILTTLPERSLLYTQCL